MTSRDSILAAIRANAPKGDHPLPAVPRFGDDRAADLLPRFAAALERMGGTLLQADPAAPLAPVTACLVPGKSVLSRVPEYAGTIAFPDDTPPRDLADVEYGIVRAAFGVAETGSVCLTDTGLVINTTGFLPQHLFVLLDPAQIVPDLHAAYRRPEWFAHRYAVLQTGPSATADIEGVLVHGAQGVRSLSVLLLPARHEHQA